MNTYLQEDRMRTHQAPPDDFKKNCKNDIKTPETHLAFSFLLPTLNRNFKPEGRPG